MKTKILYVLLIVLIIIMLISFWITRENAKIQPVSEEVKLQEIVTEQNTLPSYVQQPPSGIKPPITIIKFSVKEKPIPAEEKAEKKLKKSQKTASISVSPSQSPSVSEGEPNVPSSGVTKISKQPTEEENKEMNVRGIVMY